MKVKFSDKSSENHAKQLSWFENEFKEEFEMIKNVIYTGSYAVTNKEGVNFIPAALLDC
jgi:hypothetical protein